MLEDDPQGPCRYCLWGIRWTHCPLSAPILTVSTGSSSRLGAAKPVTGQIGNLWTGRQMEEASHPGACVASVRNCREGGGGEQPSSLGLSGF
jgi:hypothetical protein